MSSLSLNGHRERAGGPEMVADQDPTPQETDVVEEDINDIIARKKLDVLRQSVREELELEATVDSMGVPTSVLPGIPAVVRSKAASTEVQLRLYHNVWLREQQVKAQAQHREMLRRRLQSIADREQVMELKKMEKAVADGEDRLRRGNDDQYARQRLAARQDAKGGCKCMSKGKGKHMGKSKGTTKGWPVDSVQGPSASWPGDQGAQGQAWQDDFAYSDELEQEASWEYYDSGYHGGLSRSVSLPSLSTGSMLGHPGEGATPFFLSVSGEDVPPPSPLWLLVRLLLHLSVFSQWILTAHSLGFQVMNPCLVICILAQLVLTASQNLLCMPMLDQ